MSTRFDPFSLEQEMLGVIPRASFVGGRSGTRDDQDGSDDVTQIIDWTAGHPTAAERAAAAAVLSGHDPAKRGREQGERRSRIAALETKIKAGTDLPEDVRELRRLEIEYRENGGGWL